MTSLFNILDGFISNVGDIVKDRDAIESRLRELDEVEAYAEAGGMKITAADAALIRDVGLEWVANVNDGNGEWGRFRSEAEAALA